MLISIPNCGTTSNTLPNISYPGIDDLSQQKTSKGSTWQTDMQSYSCAYDCERNVADLSKALAAAYVTLNSANRGGGSSS